MDDTAKKKLKEYLASGKTYEEATVMLVSQGFTSLQIENAKIALDSTDATRSDSKINISKHPDLATSLLESTEQMTKSDSHEQQEIDAMINTNIEGLVYHSKIKGNIFVLIVGSLIIFGVLFLIVSYLIK